MHPGTLHSVLSKTCKFRRLAHSRFFHEQQWRQWCSSSIRSSICLDYKLAFRRCKCVTSSGMRKCQPAARRRRTPGRHRRIPGRCRHHHSPARSKAVSSPDPHTPQHTTAFRPTAPTFPFIRAALASACTMEHTARCCTLSHGGRSGATHLLATAIATSLAGIETLLAAIATASEALHNV